MKTNKINWDSNGITRMREATFTEVFNNVEKANDEFKFTEMEEYITKGFINRLFT